MGRLARQKRLLMEEANKRLLGEAYEGIIKKGDDSCDIWCKRKLAKNGSSGDVVRMIQHYLAKGNAEMGPFNKDKSGGGMIEACGKDWTKCDGIFRSETQKAVTEFQKTIGIKADGVVGYDTIRNLCRILGNPQADPFKSLCKDCDCEGKQKRDSDVSDAWDSVKDLWDSDDINVYIPPILKEVDCDLLKKCVSTYILADKGVDVKSFGICISGKKEVINKPIDEENCRYCKTLFPKGYVNRMPRVVLFGDEKNEYEFYSKYCVEKCGYKAAY